MCMNSEFDEEVMELELNRRLESLSEWDVTMQHTSG